MASVDQGASQRRGSSTAQSSPVGQANTLSPQGVAGESYLSDALGIHDSHDTMSQGAVFKDAQLTQIGSGVLEVSSSVGTSYRGPTLGVANGHDTSSTSARVKEQQQYFVGRTGTSTDTSSSQGTYFEGTLGGISPVNGSGGGGGGGGATTVTYKLRARDSACLITNPLRYVEWTTTVTPLTTASFPGVLPCGGPLVELTLLSQK